MSDKNKKADGVTTDKSADKGRSTTVTTVQPQDEVKATPVGDGAPDSTQLTPEEEKVIRMRYGRSLKNKEALEFAPGATEETRLKLALIEASLLEAFEAEAVRTDPDTGMPLSVIADHIDN